VVDLNRKERFRAIYVSNYARVLGYALRRTESPDDAADVVAETFLAAWRRLEDVPHGEEARLWLYGVARRVLANHRRGGVRRMRLGERLRQELSLRRQANADADADATADDQLDWLRAAFDSLRPRDQEAIALVAWEGLRTEELARALGCSPNAAKILLHRARKRFAAQLARLQPEVKPGDSSGHVGITGQRLVEMRRRSDD
jgi:RNA polymerase sigma factor (sigma-70 family)